MEIATSPNVRPRTFALPNTLTYARIAAVPLVVASMYWQDVLRGGLWLRWVALALFITAAVTDVLDGYFARSWGQQSNFGRMLDPIADKLLVGAALMMLVYDGTIGQLSIWAAIIILCREILVSGLREFLAELNVKVRVSMLAKWKTAVQMVALAVLLAGPAVEKYLPGAGTAGIALLWLAAMLTLWTGYDYLKAGIKHAISQ